MPGALKRNGTREASVVMDIEFEDAAAARHPVNAQRDLWRQMQGVWYWV